MDGISGPNWLLRSLIVFSVALHTLVFLHLSGLYRSNALTAIELSLQGIERPVARDIPRPRPRPKAPQPRDPLKPINVAQRPLPRFRPLALAPAQSDLPDSLVERISAPDLPQTPAVDSTAWVPGIQAREAADEFVSADGYLDMVRLRIESCKRYPEAARDRNIEGQVTIRFVLVTDGTVRDLTIVDASRHRSLDQAALEAVRRAAPFPRPPSHLFDKNLVLELTIEFELNWGA
jgi:protein TonB